MDRQNSLPRSIAAVLGLAVLGSCTRTGKGDSGQQTPVGASRIVLPASGWTPAGAEHPFGDPPAGSGDCPSVAYGFDGGFFEVETDQCAFAVFTQPLASEIRAGEQVEVLSWHLQLWAAEPAEARVVLQVGDVVWWEEVFAVPGAEDIQTLTPLIDHDLPAGTSAWWHIANHGSNSWRLGDAEVVAGDR